ncbi:hypothetical protein RSOLAG1IB_11421 [Rhizoctonia solani AG-1 IB]|uniref:Ricin B lectin domain-containing protein n=1 Tax=Thanatephorus cucumeris (strain AG1-IB / isolate 7/3/14) TaxID=1108050 RepID=A0A0B7F9A1_THACB|nr:hypothetical protein RSOLAG1IB_11421 [Rhizoctonia solani AG-1 IB]
MPVPLSPGLYKISTETPNGKLYVGVRPGSSPNVAGGFPVIVGPDSSSSLIELCPLEGLKYELRLFHHGGQSLGYKINQFEQGKEVVAMPNREAAEWVITDGRNPEKHRIRTIQSNLFWTTKGSASDGAPVALSPSESEGGETTDWEIEFQRSE